ncbi:MAG: DMT family transporter, partial [Pseudomonadota bacterium]
VTLGFIGTLIVLRPGLGAVHPAAFLVVLAALLFALRQIVSRVLGATDRTGTTVVYTALAGSAILSLPLPFIWVWPSEPMQWALLASIAVLAAVAEICVIKALELALAVVVAPVQYTLIVWGTLYGVLVFGDFPDGWTWIGTAIIVATGLYTLHRERMAGRRSRAVTSAVLKRTPKA